MILGVQCVSGLQFFLMDAAKRYVVPSDGRLDAADDILASAAALDYALLLSSERPGDMVDDALPIATGVRDTMARAARCALDVAERIVVASDDVVADFADRHMRAGGFFDVLRELRLCSVVADDDVSFRALTIASDLRDRLARR